MFGVIGYPLLALAGRHPFLQAEVFGWTADPTAFGTFGLLLATGLHARRLPRAVLLLIPAAACCMAVLTLWAVAGSRFGA